MITHEDFSRIDHGSFKAFTAAAKTLNFTTAAQAAAMTQSGVSQHVARLERQLGTQLFSRVNKTVSLTKAGEHLLGCIEGQREETERLFERVHGEVGRLSGKVRYGMPHSCLFTAHFPQLLKARAKFPQIELEVQLIPNETLFRKLLDRQLDFGLATKICCYDPAVRFELFAREQYVLVGRDRARLKDVCRSKLLAESFVAYPGMDVIFNHWSRHNLGAGKLSHEGLKISGSIDSLHGAITMLEHGVGLGVVPRHCVESQLKSGALYEAAPPKKGVLCNEIHIVSLKGVEQPRRVRAVLDAFWEMKTTNRC
jgi:DNA-binding transcriptional LysR family regulator